MKGPAFEWDDEKERENQVKHGVSFTEAKEAFKDPQRLEAEDVKHSRQEKRRYCIGKVKRGILTVRYTHRGHRIRIFGAGFWRQGKHLYEQNNR